MDILAEVDTEDTEQSKGLSWVQSLDSQSNEEDFVPESEPKPVEVIPPFALGSPIANANKGYQQTEDFKSATLLPANFDAPKGSRNSSDNTVQSLDLDMEKSELPEWLKEHIASSNSEDFSEFTIWQPLAQQKETDTGAPERGFNFVELANVPFTGAETSDQPDEQIPTADLFFGFLTPNHLWFQVNRRYLKTRCQMVLPWLSKPTWKMASMQPTWQQTLKTHYLKQKK